jgi:hypothetical protein
MTDRQKLAAWAGVRLDGSTDPSDRELATRAITAIDPAFDVARLDGRSDAYVTGWALGEIKCAERGIGPGAARADAAEQMDPAEADRLVARAAAAALAAERRGIEVSLLSRRDCECAIGAADSFLRGDHESLDEAVDAALATPAADSADDRAESIAAREQMIERHRGAWRAQ